MRYFCLCQILRGLVIVHRMRKNQITTRLLWVICLVYKRSRLKISQGQRVTYGFAGDNQQSNVLKVTDSGWMLHHSRSSTAQPPSLDINSLYTANKI